MHPVLCALTSEKAPSAWWYENISRVAGGGELEGENGLRRVTKSVYIYIKFDKSLVKLITQDMYTRIREHEIYGRGYVKIIHIWS